MTTQMHVEAAQAASTLRSQFGANGALVQELGAKLRALRPRAVVTCARGSSSHAATYAKHLIEKRIGIVTATAALSLSSVYASSLELSDTVCLAISQSGASPDLLSFVTAARSRGAIVLALVNDEQSALAAAADYTLPLHANPELSVAATKSFIASLHALTMLVAAWAQDDVLWKATQKAPSLLEQAWQLDWSPAVSALANATNLYVVGRGPGLAIAQEAALKFKEVCGIHAEAFSAAEIRHGPTTLAQANFPILVFAQQDEAMPGLEQLTDELVNRDVKLILAGLERPSAINLPTIATHSAIEPLLSILSFYRLADALAGIRQRDPDAPPFLAKVTRTV